MNKKLLIVGIAVLLICVGLSGCTQESTVTDESKIVGFWEIEDSSGEPSGIYFEFTSTGYMYKIHPDSNSELDPDFMRAYKFEGGYLYLSMPSPLFPDADFSDALEYKYIFESNDRLRLQKNKDFASPDYYNRIK
ncbi:hypothetical protein MBGDN05_00777 [Thermoplasmatales archaeon SCGC AB-539-N05]|nr:hypothetical protein MBGDN05_00777 [Thermoplasmatales archaeon SCGC AB-539-N05]